MPYITTSDGTEIYYTEHGVGRPIVLSHGWPLSSDAWQVEMKLFADADTGPSRTIVEDTVARRRRTPATTWIHMPRTWLS